MIPSIEFPSACVERAWINPEPEGLWQYRQSISLVSQIIGGRMFPLTLEGLTRAMRMLIK